MEMRLFFDSVRKSLFSGRLLPPQVVGLNHIIGAWNAAPDVLDNRWVAYALATVCHETEKTMQPIREKGSKAYFFRMYDKDSPDAGRRRVAARLGNVMQAMVCCSTAGAMFKSREGGTIFFLNGF